MDMNNLVNRFAAQYGGNMPSFGGAMPVIDQGPSFGAAPVEMPIQLQEPTYSTPEGEFVGPKKPTREEMDFAKRQAEFKRMQEKFGFNEDGIIQEGKYAGERWYGPETKAWVRSYGIENIRKKPELMQELEYKARNEARKYAGLEPLPEPEATPPQADIKDVFGAHKEYYDQSKQYHLMGQALNKMLKSVQMDSAAGDLGLIFGLMKALDPTSVVRESEQASAENAAGVPERIRNLYNKLINGERLSPKQRMDFLRQAQGMFQALEEEQAVRDKYFTGYAQRHGMNVDDVVANPYLELNNKVQEYFNKFNADPKNRQLLSEDTSNAPDIPGISKPVVPASSHAPSFDFVYDENGNLVPANQPSIPGVRR